MYSFFNQNWTSDLVVYLKPTISFTLPAVSHTFTDFPIKKTVQNRFFLKQNSRSFIEKFLERRTKLLVRFKEHAEPEPHKRLIIGERRYSPPPHTRYYTQIKLRISKPMSTFVTVGLIKIVQQQFNCRVFNLMIF